MTEQPESRWTLASTGNRVLLAVVVGLVVSVLAGILGAHGATRVAVFAVAAGAAYALTTLLRRS